MRKHIIPLMGKARENLDLVCLCIINKSTRNHNRNIRRIRIEYAYDMYAFWEQYFLNPTSSKRKPSCHLSFGVYASYKIKYMLHYMDTKK